MRGIDVQLGNVHTRCTFRMGWVTLWMHFLIPGEQLEEIVFAMMVIGEKIHFGRAFMNAQEKRAEQLKSLGIEEAEISTNVIQSTGGETLL